MNQYNKETVERIIRRDFAEPEWDRVSSLLEQYGCKPHHLEKHRTQLSVLKLANGCLRDVEIHVKIACVDFRDVLAPAQEPNLFARGFLGMSLASKEELDAATRQDAEQFESWLRSS